MASWRNWSGSVRCTPARIVRPESEAALAELLAGARGGDLPIRIVGSGHSYTPLVETTGTIVSLDNLQGIVSIDPASRRAVIRGGTRLFTLGAPLRDQGLSLLNQGDVDYQALAGALATATHGTGITLGCLSSGIAGLRLVLVDGSILECDATREPDVLRAARLNLGCFGAVSTVTLDVRPAYRILDQTRVQPLEATLEALPELVRKHRRLECWWFPHADVIGQRTMDDTDQAPNDRPLRRWISEAVVDNLFFGAVAGLTRLPGLAGLRPGLSRVVAKAAGEPPYIDWSYRVLATGRTVKANEMEYAVPAERGPDAIRAIRKFVRGHRTPVLFPIEYRYVAADDIPLSPFYGRDSAVLSVHQDARVDYTPYFSGVEPLLRDLGGRPHWGKLHSLAAAELEPLYPEWGAFQAVRARLDPGGKLMTPYLRRVLGVS
ncbi:MAG: D-arabinono-1,4-lactone oxidase [Gemmatimonadales bacterium]